MLRGLTPGSDGVELGVGIVPRGLLLHQAVVAKVRPYCQNPYVHLEQIRNVRVRGIRRSNTAHWLNG